MILFWGSKGYQKDLGHTQTAIECGHCNNVDTWEIVETGRKFTLYWIPLFPYGKSYFVSCPICHYGTEPGKNKEGQQDTGSLSRMVKVKKQTVYLSVIVDVLRKKKLRNLKLKTI